MLGVLAGLYSWFGLVRMHVSVCTTAAARTEAVMGAGLVWIAVALWVICATCGALTVNPLLSGLGAKAKGCSSVHDAESTGDRG